MSDFFSKNKGISSGAKPTDESFGTAVLTVDGSRLNVLIQSFNLESSKRVSENYSLAEGKHLYVFGENFKKASVEAIVISHSSNLLEADTDSPMTDLEFFNALEACAGTRNLNGNQSRLKIQFEDITKDLEAIVLSYSISANVNMSVIRTVSLNLIILD